MAFFIPVKSNNNSPILFLISFRQLNLSVSVEMLTLRQITAKEQCKKFKCIYFLLSYIDSYSNFLYRTLRIHILRC